MLLTLMPTSLANVRWVKPGLEWLPQPGCARLKVGWCSRYGGLFFLANGFFQGAALF